MKTIYSELAVITPEIAKRMLDTSTGNPRFGVKSPRQYDMVAVKRLAAYMREGKWKLNGEAIIFNENGELVDGHHRLAAVIESGCTIQQYVTYGVDKDIHLFDIGGKGQRRDYQVMRDELGMRPKLASTRTQALATLHFLFVNQGNEKATREITFYEKGRFILDHQDSIDEVLRICEKESMNKKKLLQNAWFAYAFLCALECGIPVSEIEEFARIVATGLCNDERKYAAVVCKQALTEGAWNSKTQKACMDKVCYIETALQDFYNKVARQRRYMKTEAVYTKEFLRKEYKKQKELSATSPDGR